jgi:hypothetical protein
MCRENRGDIADAEVDLTLREILDMPQARSSQIRIREDGAAKIRIIKNCVA